MFFLLKLKVTLIVEPKEISSSLSLTLSHKLQEKVLFKTIDKQGLCVSIINHTILTNKIAPSSANAQADILCTCLVLSFQPNMLLLATIKNNTSEGLVVTLAGQHIFIPGIYLNTPSKYDSTLNKWFWMYEGHHMFYNPGMDIKLKVYKQLMNREDDDLLLNGQQENTLAIGRTNEDGLGPVEWWN